MVSYADFYQMPARRRQAMEQGLHGSLGIPRNIKIYLDNGAFYFSKRGLETPAQNYEEFVRLAQPDWRPIPRDFIPAPNMTLQEQRSCLDRTMQVNKDFQHDGYVPVIHVSQVLSEYVDGMKAHDLLAAKPAIALGGIVPHLLRMSKARPYQEILDSLRYVRHSFFTKQLHLFGVGGTSTLHVAALLGIDSVDSSGWRNRAARGIVQLPGSGDRIVAQLGSWRGRTPSEEEWEILVNCLCPACKQHGRIGLQASGLSGFCNRATHNLATLIGEAQWIEEHLSAGTYAASYKDRLDNSIYRPIIEQLVETFYSPAPV